MKRVDANGQKIAVEVAGAGPPLLLMHGGEGDRTMFADLAARLTPYFTVLSYDQRDSGQTENTAEDYGFSDLAEDAAALIAALGYDRAHVFGQSLGGVIAQALAVLHPERVDRLVLSSTFRLGASPVPLNPSVFAHIGEMRQRLPDMAPDIARYFFPDAYLEDHPHLSAMFAGGGRTPEQAARRARLGGAPVQGDIASIQAPTLVLAGSEDRLIPPDHTRSLAEAIPRGRFEWVAGAGHVAPIQDPDAVAEAVRRFLTTP